MLQSFSVKHRKNVGILPFFALFFFNSINITTVNASQVILKSGKILYGDIISMESETLNIQNDKGELSQIVRSQVKEIKFDAKAPSPIKKDIQEASPNPTKKNTVKNQLSSVDATSSKLMLPSADDQALFERVFNGPSKDDMKQGAFASPKHTFESWRRASVEGNLKAMVKCYSSFRQGQVKKQLKKIPRKKRRDMQEVSRNTLFTLSQPYYQGDRARLEVTWNHGLKSDTQTLRFILENKEWKIIE